MPEPATHSHRQLCDGLRHLAGRTVDSGLGLGINHLAIPIEAHERATVVAPARDHVAARQHSSRKASVRMKVQRDMQIFSAGARNAVNIAIAGQVERADALVGVEPH